METAPVEPEASSARTTEPLPTASLPGPSSSPTILGLPEADIQRIAQAVATILKKPEAPSSSPLVSGPSSTVAPPIGKSLSSVIAFSGPSNLVSCKRLLAS